MENQKYNIPNKIKHEKIKKMKIQQSKDWLKRSVYTVLTESGEYKIVNGRFLVTLGALGHKCYKLIGGKWVYVCFYFSEQRLSILTIIQQIDYEIAIKRVSSFDGFIPFGIEVTKSSK